MKPNEMVATIVIILMVSCVSRVALAQCDGSQGPCENDNAAVTSATAADVSSAKGPVAQEATVEKERIKPLWIGGLVAFGVSYMANIIVTAKLAEDEYRSKAVGFAAIPLVGQFFSIAEDSDDYPIPPEYKGPMILGAMLQIVSAGVFTAGMIIKREPKKKQARRGPRFGLAPVVLGRNGAGAVFSVTHF